MVKILAPQRHTFESKRKSIDDVNEKHDDVGSSCCLLLFQNVYGDEYTMLEISYLITAFEVISSVVFLIAIIIWRRWTRYVVHKVSIRARPPTSLIYLIKPRHLKRRCFSNRRVFAHHHVD